MCTKMSHRHLLLEKIVHNTPFQYMSTINISEFTKSVHGNVLHPLNKKIYMYKLTNCDLPNITCCYACLAKCHMSCAESLNTYLTYYHCSGPR